MYTIITAFITFLLCVLPAILINIFTQTAGGDFQYPLLRASDKRPGPFYPLISASFILVYFILTGYLILFGLAIPLIPKLSSNVSPFLLAVAGMSTVGLIRFLTLTSSIATFRAFVNTLVITTAFSLIIAWFDPTAYNAAINQARTNLPHFLSIPFLAIFILFLTDISWYFYIKANKSQRASRSFIESIQHSISSDEIGYQSPNIYTAYKKAIFDVITSNGVWEFIWISSRGADRDFYEYLIKQVAARRAMDLHDITAVETFDLLPDGQKNQYVDWAKKHLNNVGMFMIESKEAERIRQFKDVMDFEPGKFDKPLSQRFMIINRRVLITSWSAHNTRLTYDSDPRFRSTMYSRSEDPSKIETYLKWFDGLWGEYQMNRVGAIFRKLSSDHKKLLDIIIDRSGVWSLSELSRTCKTRIDRDLTIDQVRRLLQDLVTQQLIKEINQDTYSRVHTVYAWQDRWLRIHRDFMEI